MEDFLEIALLVVLVVAAAIARSRQDQTSRKASSTSRRTREARTVKEQPARDEEAAAVAMFAALRCPRCGEHIGDLEAAAARRKSLFMPVRGLHPESDEANPVPLICPRCKTQSLYLGRPELVPDDRPTWEAGVSAMGNALLAYLPGPDADFGELRHSFGELSRQFFREFSDWGSPALDERAQELALASLRSHRAGSPVSYGPAELLLAMREVIGVAPYVGLPDDLVLSYMHSMLRDLRIQLSGP